MHPFHRFSGFSLLSTFHGRLGSQTRHFVYCVIISTPAFYLFTLALVCVICLFAILSSAFCPLIRYLSQVAPPLTTMLNLTFSCIALHIFAHYKVLITTNHDSVPINHHLETNAIIPCRLNSVKGDNTFFCLLEKFFC